MNTTQEEKIYKCVNCGVEGRKNPTPPYTLAEQFIVTWFNFEDKNVCSDMCYEITKNKNKTDINDDDLGMPKWLYKKYKK